MYCTHVHTSAMTHPPIQLRVRPGDISNCWTKHDNPKLVKMRGDRGARQKSAQLAMLVKIEFRKRFICVRV